MLMMWFWAGFRGMHKQADMCTHMAEQCALHWLPHLKVQGNGIMPLWGLEYGHFLIEAAHESCDNATPELETTDDFDTDGNETGG